MIDFSTLQGLSIPEGVVTQIESGGVVLWKLAVDVKPAVLQVTKKTATTYAGETKYENEQFIILDIYPKKNGTVNVTYGGLTKTVKDTSGAAEPNATRVFFGTFNGVSDSVVTPESGTLTIEGAYNGYGLGSYGAYSNKSSGSYQPHITGVVDIGEPLFIPDSAFRSCTSVVIDRLPDSVTEIRSYAFYGCSSLALTSLPENLTDIGDFAFNGCLSLNITAIPEGVTNIGADAFHMDTTSYDEIAMFRTTITFPSTLESIGDRAFRYDRYSGSGDYFYFTYVGTAVMLCETPPTLGDDVFGNGGVILGQDYMTIIVPKGCAETYKAASVWGTSYKRTIVEAS